MDAYGLVGKKLQHSFSCKYFTEKFENENIEAVYQNFELAAISEVSNLLKNKNLKGFNVTIPYKRAIIPYLNFVYAPISLLNAVNTVRIIKQSKKNILYGFNTDVYGFYHSLLPLLKSHHKKALILGTGGASAAVAFVLNKLKIKYLLVSRNSTKGLLYSELNENILADYHLIINCTPIGQSPDIDAKPLIPYSFLTPKHLLYDLIYNPAETTFLREGKQYGTFIKNGLEMLYLQAQKTWEIFNTNNLTNITLF